MKKKLSVLTILVNLDLFIAGIASVILLVVTIVGIVFRYVLGSPFAWLEEITSWCFLWSILLGACAAFRTKSHVAIEIVVEYLPRTAQRVVEVLIMIITGVLLLYMTYQAVIYLGTVAGAQRVSGLLRLPYVMIYGMLPISTFLMFINMIYVFFREVRAWGKPDEKTKAGENK